MTVLTSNTDKLWKLKKMFRKVVVSISGGVDSAVAALHLKSKGFKVTAVFMRNWDIANEVGECQSDKDFEDAKWICNKLNIPLIDVNFVKDYWNEVFSDLLDNYERGKTPNPDIQCNKKIKFDKFFHFAQNELEADAISTGHYARSSFGPYLEYFNPEKSVSLIKAKDFFKDQTFFLSQVPQMTLARTMFPLGEYLKTDIKQIAKEANLDIVIDKKESMGICFIGKRHFQDFIVEYVENKPGEFIDIETGLSLGKHSGIHHWTLGQRCRIGGLSAPYFIYRNDVDNNVIYVVRGTAHPALFTDFVVTSKPHWINKEPVQLNKQMVFNCEFRFQHRNPLISCSIFKTTSNKLLIHLSQPLRAITPGQFAVFYSGEECLGSAEILHPGPNYYFLDKEVDDSSVTVEKLEVSQY